MVLAGERLSKEIEMAIAELMSMRNQEASRINVVCCVKRNSSTAVTFLSGYYTIKWPKENQDSAFAKNKSGVYFSDMLLSCCSEWEIG